MIARSDVRERPCSTCPYRRDVPSGIWAVETYELLLKYDGDISRQVEHEAFAPFGCHKTPGFLCAGWVGCHNQTENLALRLAARRLAPRVWTYASPVPLFGTAAEAVAHGVRDIGNPSPEAARVIRRLMRDYGDRFTVGRE